MTPIRVLVIEDDTNVREGLVVLLEEKGCMVVAACNGSEGLRLARSKPPEVITLDLEMPVMDGWSFRRFQQGDPALANIPVIIVTASVAKGDITAAAFIAKPCDFDALVASVTEHGRRYREENRPPVGAPSLSADRSPTSGECVVRRR